MGNFIRNNLSLILVAIGSFAVALAINLQGEAVTRSVNEISCSLQLQSATMSMNKQPPIKEILILCHAIETAKDIVAKEELAKPGPSASNPTDL